MNSSSSPSPASPSTARARSSASDAAHPGWHAAVDQDLGARGDHVLLPGGAGLGRHQRHPQHRLGQVGGDLGGRLAQPLDRGCERLAIVRVDLLPAQRRDEGHALGRRLERRLLAQALERRRQLQERVVAQARHRGVAGDAAGSHQEAARSLLAHAERVEAPPVELERDAPALVEHVVGSHLVGMLAAQPLRPRRGSHLLVGGGDDQELSLARAPAVAAERRGRGHLGGDLVLHVLSASAANLPVHDVARPGIEAPLGGIGGDGVRVAEQAQRRPGALPAQPRDQVRAAGLGGQQLALEAGLGQGLGQQLLGVAPRCRAGWRCRS